MTYRYDETTKCTCEIRVLRPNNRHVKRSLVLKNAQYMLKQMHKLIISN